VKNQLPSEKRKKLSNDAGQEAKCETRRIMESKNLGLDRGLVKLEQLLEATKPIPSAKRMVPDNQAQGHALDVLLTLGDYYPTKKVKGDLNIKGALNINIIDRFGADDQSKAGKKTQQKPT
jgi:hypothetical protein